MQYNWIRTCQECGYKGNYKPPMEYKGDSWKDTLCRRCKSAGLDYGRAPRENELAVK